jgi:hypothetical protein
MWTETEADASVVPQAHERRCHQRDDLCFKVRFSVLGVYDALRVLDHLEQGLNAQHGSALTESYTQNLSSGGLGLYGRLDPRGPVIKEGDFLKIEIQPPRIDSTVRCLGEVAWVEIDTDAEVFRAGVSFLGVNPEDLKKLRPSAD